MDACEPGECGEIGFEVRDEKTDEQVGILWVSRDGIAWLSEDTGRYALRSWESLAYMLAGSAVGARQS